MKKFICLILALACFPFCITGFAEEITRDVDERETVQRADPVFVSVYINMVGLNAEFSATALYAVNIRVSSCWAEKLVNGKWTYFRSLAAPTASYNQVYAASRSYSSSDFPSGATYRVAGTFSTPDHSATRYSGQFTR